MRRQRLSAPLLCMSKWPCASMRLIALKLRHKSLPCGLLSKTKFLHNPADRDHCLQYMVAVGLLKGDLTADDYSDAAAQDGRIDQLRGLMRVTENPLFSQDYLDPQKRSIANSVQVFFKDGSKTELKLSEYPIGHVKRRDEGLPLLLNKFQHNLKTQFTEEKVCTIMNFFESDAFLSKEIKDLADLFCV